ncbi:MAG: ABC transporter substrate-binding protein [Armatimonadota bacterium]
MGAHRRMAVVIVATVLLLVPATAPLAQTTGEKVLRMGYTADFVTLDPPRITTMPDYPIAMNLFNGLVRYKPNGLDVEPDLAERYEASKDGLTYTFWLRKSVKFHKGFGDFTARDVKFSFERVLDPRLRSPYAPQMQLIRQIEIVNDHLVKIHLSGPYADFLPAVLAFRPGYIVSQKAVEQFGAQFGSNPIGTGPYMLERYAPRQEIVFVAHAEYFGRFRSGARRTGGRAHIDRVLFKIIPEETVIVLAMSKGELDYAPIRTAEAFKLVRNDQKLAYTATPVLGRRSLWVNTQRPPLTDLRVRRALSHAINHKEFVDTVEEGMGTVEGMWSEIPSGVFGHIDDAPSFPYDPDRARALLAEARLGGMRPLVIVFRSTDRSFAQAVRGYWTKVGVPVTLDELGSAPYEARRSSGDFDFLITGPTRVAPDQFLLPLQSDSVPNFYGRIDSLIRAQRREVDPAKRRAILRQIQIRISSDLPVIPVYRPYYVTAFRKGVTGDVANTFYWLWYWELMDITQ